MTGLRVGYEVASLPISRSGVSRYVEELLGGLLATRRDIDFQLLAHRPQSEFGVASRHALTPQREAPSFPVRLAWMQLILPAWLARANLDVCHFTNYHMPLPCPVPAVVTFHDMSVYIEPERHPKKRLLVHRALLPLVARRADAIIAVSESTRTDIIERLRVPPQRVHVVYEAASAAFRPVEDGASLDGIRRRYHVEGKFALYVGTIEPRKNLDRVVEALDQLRRQGAQVPLLLAGEMGWKNTALMSRIAERGMEDCVRFLGYVPDEDLPGLISLATAFVYPSVYEGFGLPILEAMSCGTPVVTSRGGATGEVAGDAALTIDPGDVDEMAEAIGSLFTDADLHQRLSDAGRRRAAEFSWTRAAEETARIYEMVAHRQT